MSERMSPAQELVNSDTPDQLTDFLRRNERVVRDLEILGFTDIQAELSTSSQADAPDTKAFRIVGVTTDGRHIAFHRLEPGIDITLEAARQEISDAMVECKTQIQDAIRGRIFPPEKRKLTEEEICEEQEKEMGRRLLGMLPIHSKIEKGSRLIVLHPEENKAFYPEGEKTYYGRQTDRMLYQLWKRGVDVLDQDVSFDHLNVLNPNRHMIGAQKRKEESIEKLDTISKTGTIVAYTMYEPPEETTWTLTVIHRPNQPADEWREGDRRLRLKMLRQESFRELLYSQPEIRAAGTVFLVGQRSDKMKSYHVPLKFPCIPNDLLAGPDDPHLLMAMRQIIETAENESFTRIEVQVVGQTDHELHVQMNVWGDAWEDTAVESEYSGSFASTDADVDSLNASFRDSLPDSGDITKSVKESYNESLEEHAGNFAMLLDEKLQEKLGYSFQRVEVSSQIPDERLYSISKSATKIEVELLNFNGANYEVDVPDELINDLANVVNDSGAPGLLFYCTYKEYNADSQKLPTLTIVVFCKHG